MADSLCCRMQEEYPCRSYEAIKILVLCNFREKECPWVVPAEWMLGTQMIGKKVVNNYHDFRLESVGRQKRIILRPFEAVVFLVAGHNGGD